MCVFLPPTLGRHAGPRTRRYSMPDVSYRSEHIGTRSSCAQFWVDTRNERRRSTPRLFLFYSVPHVLCVLFSLSTPPAPLRGVPESFHHLRSRLIILPAHALYLAMKTRGTTSAIMELLCAEKHEPGCVMHFVVFKWLSPCVCAFTPLVPMLRGPLRDRRRCSGPPSGVAWRL